MADIDVREAHQRVADGAVLLDVRNDDEFAAGHAPGATHIPLSELMARADELDTDTPLVVICRSGGRSARATSWLVQHGWDAVNVAGGMQAWQAASIDMTNDGPEPPVVA